MFVPRCQSQRRKGPGSSLYDGGWSAGPTTRRGETEERAKSTEIVPWSGSYIWEFRGEEVSQRKISSTERRCRKVEGKTLNIRKVTFVTLGEDTAEEVLPFLFTVFFATFLTSLSLSLSSDCTLSRLSTLEFLVRLTGSSLECFLEGFLAEALARAPILLGFCFCFCGRRVGGDGDFLDLD